MISKNTHRRVGYERRRLPGELAFAPVMSNDTDSDDESEYAYDNGGGGGRNLDEDAAMETAILESAAVAAASAVAAAAAAAANLASKACSSSSLKSAPLPSTPNGTEVRRVRAKVEGGTVEIIQRLEPTPTKNGEAWYDEPCSNFMLAGVARGVKLASTKRSKIQGRRESSKLCNRAIPHRLKPRRRW